MPILAVVGVLAAVILVAVDKDLFEVAIVVAVGALVLATLTQRESP